MIENFKNDRFDGVHLSPIWAFSVTFPFIIMWPNVEEIVFWRNEYILQKSESDVLSVILKRDNFITPYICTFDDRSDYEMVQKRRDFMIITIQEIFSLSLQSSSN